MRTEVGSPFGGSENQHGMVGNQVAGPEAGEPAW